MLVIGDIHGNIQYYDGLIKGLEKSIQVGDFGFKGAHDWHMKNVSPDHKVNFGNHDYYPYLNEAHSLGNFSYHENIFTIRGAHSIDRWKRNEGVDWFSNEELNYQETDQCIDLYEKVKPEVVIAHDCPMFVATELFDFPRQVEYTSHTRLLLESLVKTHTPKIFIFGHHHKERDAIIEGTRYICLGISETFNL
jgi:hypothetical protein